MAGCARSGAWVDLGRESHLGRHDPSVQSDDRAVEFLETLYGEKQVDTRGRPEAHSRDGMQHAIANLVMVPSPLIEINRTKKSALYFRGV